LFDEPLSNLDAKLRRQVREDIREIQQKLGVTTIYVTHDQEEALAISDKVIVMNKAVIAQEGSPKDLYNFPKNKFVANFIGDANDVTAEIINKQSNTYDLKLAEMNVKIEINKDLNDKVSLALRPEKIKINRANNENCIHASIKSASFVGSSYQYILSSKIGELYVVSGDTTDIFKVGEEVFLSIDEKDIKILND
jgi:iron(III) transport system ATP-binding protein